MDLLKDLAKASGNELAGVVSDGIVAGDVDGYIDTGSYIFNALVSGDIYRGIPSNKITALAGESATGKTFFALGMVQKFLEDNPEGNVVYFESESAISKQMIEDRGIPSDRMMIVPVSTIEQFRTQACRILDKYEEQSEEKRQALRAWGAKVVITPTNVDADDPRSYYKVSERLVQETENACYGNQYHNPSNPKTHYLSTGPEIWEQLDGNLDVFIAGVGTGGTISGCAKYLK